MGSLIFGSLMVTAAVLTTPNTKAHKQVLLASYKQSGLEEVVNKKVTLYVDNYLDKQDKVKVIYLYQLFNAVNNKGIVIGFSF